jgi:hypothetical protein
LGLFELAALGVFAAVSLWVLGLDLWQVIVHGRHWTGTDGLFLSDQMQYLSWIQDSSRHVLASNLFVLHRTPTDYFQPLVAISGAVAALGIAPWLVLLLWKPVAVIAAFVVVYGYSRRCLTGLWQRRAALVLGLFFGSWGVLGDLWLPLWSWGYPFGLIAIAAMGGALLLYDRARAENRVAWAPALLGALASSLHPWQGEALILIVIGAEVVMRWKPRPQREVAEAMGSTSRDAMATLVATEAADGEARRRLGRRVPGGAPALGQPSLGADGSLALGRATVEMGRRPVTFGPIGELRALVRGVALPATTVIATAIPLLYLIILGRVDVSWGLAREASHHSFPLASILLAIAPLLAASAPAYRGRPRSFIAAATRAWPLAALAVYALSATSLSATPLHAFAGITLPLGVLAVEGIQRLDWRRLPGRRALAALAIAALTIPAGIYELAGASDYMSPSVGNANFVSGDMSRALGYLKSDPRPGGVLTRAYLGVIVPGLMGRNTYVGGCQWSQPNCAGRTTGAEALFDGSLTPQAAQSFVLGTTARFVLAGCGWGSDLAAPLAPITRSVRRFGCATVIEIR